MKRFKLYLIIICVSGISILIHVNAEIFAAAGPISVWEIPSAFSPVGSGARAIGMGGAFIAVADDATAASWNPGGLTNLLLPEFSIVTGFNRRKEANTFQMHPEASGPHHVSEEEINYLSIAYPFRINHYNMIVSLTYQRLYDLNRQWTYQYGFHDFMFNLTNTIDYTQDGSLSAIGLSYCIDILPELAFGVTFNFWDDHLSDNSWYQEYHVTRSGDQMGDPLTAKYDKRETYIFKGFNMNLGMLWHINEQFIFGAVVKTPFKADIEHEVSQSWEERFPLFPEADQVGSNSDIRNEEIQMPLSYGMGLVYKFSDILYMSGDLYRTDWRDFTYKNENGYESNPINGKSIHESKMASTHHVRFGAEYLHINKAKNNTIALRVGLFYDPAPAENNPDDIYGLSLGAGFTQNDQFSIDIAYQLRIGNDAGQSYLQEQGFSQDIKEHKFYLSSIVYIF